MQELHLVGFTTDRRHLIFSARQGAKSGSYLVPVDDELLAAVDDLAEAAEREDDEDAEEPVERAPRAPRVEAQLSVREVQARLRAGDDVSDIAAHAGVDEEWVERFAPPVRAEQRQIVERALATPMFRPRSGESSVPLRRAVAAAMAERGVTFTADRFEAAWSSRLVGADRWEVGFSFVQRGRRRRVAWVFDASDGTLTADDRTASQLGFVAADDTVPPESETIAPAGTGPLPPPPSEPAGTSASGQKAGARKTARKTKSRSKKRTTTKKKAAPEKRAATKKRTAPKKKGAPKKKSAPKKRAATKKKAAAKKRAATKKKVATKKRAATKKKGAPRKKVSTKKAAAPEKRAATTAEAAAAPPPVHPPARPATVRTRTPEERRSPEAGEEPAVRILGTEPPASPPSPPPPRTEPAAPDHPVDRVEARRARAAERSAPTAQFRSGSAVRARSADGNGAGTIRIRPDGAVRARPDRPRADQDRAGEDRDGEDRSDRPRPAGGNGTPAPADRRPRRTRQLRAR